MNYANLTKEDLISKLEKLERERDELRDKPELTFDQATENEFLKERQFTDKLINSLPGIFYLYSIDGDETRLIKWNKNHEKVTGYSAEELRDMKIFDFFSEKEYPTIREAFNKLTKTGEIGIEANLKLKNGELIPHYFEGHMLSDTDGNFLLGVGLDITKQIESENKLKASEEKYRRIFETMQDGYLLADIDGKLVSANPSAIRILGYNNEEELIGKSLGHDIHTDDKEREKTLKDLIINDKVLNREQIFRKKNKDEIYVDCNIQVIKNAQGKVIATEGTFRDITKRRLAEEELKKYQNNLEGLVKERTIELEKSHKENLKLSKAIEQSHATVVITDRDGNIEYVNPNFTRTTGYSADEAINQNPRILKSGQMPQSYYKEMWDTISSGKIWKGDFINKKKNGELYWESTIISPILNDKDEVSHFVAVKEDVTHRKQIESELKKSKELAEEANRLKSAFLSNMSHEIRTPMNAILGFSEILSRHIKDRNQLDYLSSIQSSGKTLLQLINDILDLSKIESGKLDLSYEPVNIQNLVKDTVEMLKMESHEKGLPLNTSISKDLPSIVNIDELRIKQLLINLLNNAIKFTKKGYIEVEIGCLNKKKRHLDLLIKVEDTGIGISKKNQQNIFQAFNQIEGKDSKRFEGTGLGLAITKQLVTLMNGTIKLESVVGKGSIFTIVLNKVKYNEAVVEFENSIDFDPDSLEFEESSVLIVDNIKTNRDVLKAYLSSYNIKIIEAEDGKEALTAIEKYKPDLVFLDLRMPVMDGYEAHKIIMKNPNWSRIPIIAITASAFDKDEKKIIALGFSGYIRKPAGLIEILSCLMKHLKHTAEVKHEDIAVEVTIESIDKLDEVLLEIDKKAMPVWKEIMKIRKMKDVLLLSEFLVEIGKKYNAGSLIQYGNELQLATQSFNIDKELKLVQQFPDYVKRLNSSSNGN